MRLSRGGCEVGEGVEGRESGTRGVGVAQRGDNRGGLLLKPGFGFESGTGEDGREVLTSEPRQEVAGDFLYSSPQSVFRPDFALNGVKTGQGTAFLNADAFPVANLSAHWSSHLLLLVSVKPTVREWLASVLCDVEQANPSCSSRG